MVSNIEFLEAICERMRQIGLIESKAAFSSRMLGRNPSYLTSMKARERQVPEEVMAFLMQRLESDIADEDAEIAELRERLRSRELRQRHRTDLLHHVAAHGQQSEFIAGMPDERERSSLIARIMRAWRARSVCQQSSHSS